MEESHYPDIEAEIADAMQSFHRSSSESSEGEDDKLNRNKTIEYDNWKCRLVKEESRCMIYIDGLPTHLQQFADKQNVDLELLHNLLYLRVDDKLHIVTISKDGKAKVTPWSTVGNTSPRTTEKPGSAECRRETLVESEPSETGKDKIRKQFTNQAIMMTDQYDKEQDNDTDFAHSHANEPGREICQGFDNIDGDIKLCIKEQQWVLCARGVESCLEIEDNKSVTLETSGGRRYIRIDGKLFELLINSNEKAHIHPVEEAISCGIERQEKQNKNPAKTNEVSDDKCKPMTGKNISLSTEQDRSSALPCKVKEGFVKLLKRDNKWSLSLGDKETFLDLDENAVVSLESSDEDVYIQADGTLYEVLMNVVGDITVTKIREAIVVDETMKHESNQYDYENRNKEASDNSCRSVSSTRKSKTETDKIKSQSLRLHTEKVPNPHDIMLTQSLHSKNIKYLPVSENKDVILDRKKNKITEIATNQYEAGGKINQATSQGIPEMLQPIFPDDKNAPSNVSSNNTTQYRKSDNETLSSTSPPNIEARRPCNKAFHNTSDTGTCTMEHGGAIPKTSKSVPTTTCNDDGYSASVNRRTAAKEIDQTDHAKAPGKQTDAEKDRERKQEPVVSTAVRVDDDNVFKFLTMSKIIKRMSETNRVKIVPLKVSGCQGFEITGAPKSMQNTEKALKDILMNISTETLTLEANDLSANRASEGMASINNKIEEKYDVLTKISICEGKTEGRSKYHHSTSEEKVNSQAKSSKAILKRETPKSVIWLFPGGYAVTLCNKPIEETTASIIVKFTEWNGKEKQISSSTSPDGFGGFIHHVSVGLPMCNDTEANKDALKGLLSKVFLKSGEEGKSSITFSLQNILNWSCHIFVDCLLAVTWEHFRAPNHDKPVFVELCSPKTDEYHAAHFHCLRIVTEMEKELECLHVEQLKTEIVEGELNKTKAEILVNTTSPTLHLNAGAVSVALLKMAGDRLQDDCKTYYPRGINWGEIAVTQGYALPCSYVFHGALPAFMLDKMKMSEAEKFTAFRNLMEACLTKASELGCRTIAFPVLGAGNLKYPVDLVASEMLLSVEKFQKRYCRSTLRAVYIVVYPADKQTLHIFRRLQSELNATDDAQQRPQASFLETSRKDEDIVESITVELTGMRPVLDDARPYIKKKWKKLVATYAHTFRMRLPHSLGEGICNRKHSKLTRHLEDMNTEVSEIESKFYATVDTFEGLKNAFSVIDKFSVNKSGQQYSLGQFDEVGVIVEMHNISITDFKVMEKLNQSTIHKYERDGVRIYHGRNSVFIEGKAKYIESVLNETEKLFAYVRKFETFCIDGDKCNIPKQLMSKIVNKTETRVAGKPDICVLLDQTQNKLHIFARSKQVLLDMRRGVLDEVKVHSEGQGDRTASQDGRQKIQTARSTVGLKTTEPIHVPTKSGVVKLFTYRDDLLVTPVQCIVNAANEHLTLSAGVAAAIANAAGSELITETATYYRRHGKVPAGDVVETTAGNLKHKYKYILHAVGPNWRDYQPLTHDKLDHCKLAVQSAVHKCLDLVDGHKLKSVAIPAISAGYQGVPNDICALQYAEGVNRYLETTKRPTIEEIHFVDLNDDTIKQIKQTFLDYFVDRKVVNVDSRYLIGKGVTASETFNLKMACRSKTDTGKSEIGDLSKSETVKVHRTSQTVSSTDVSHEKVKTNPGGTVLEHPLIWESSSKATVIQFTTNQKLQLYTANILELHSSDVIVICEDPSGNNGGRLAQDLLVKGAAKYITEKGKAFQSNRMLSFGEVVVTGGGDSQFKFVFHALLHQRHIFPQTVSKWYDAFQKILGVIFNKAVSMKCSSIAMPVIGTDSKTQDISEYARRFLETYKAFCIAKPTQDLAVHLISNEPSLTKTLSALFERHIRGQRRSSGNPAPVYPPSVKELIPDIKKDDQTPSENIKEIEAADCVICLDKLDNPKKLKCGHEFCCVCISQHLKTKQNCPVCGKVFGKLTGNQPPGIMKSEIITETLPGYKRCRTIRIVYVFNSGVQGPEHPEPGKPYTGISRVAFLPDNEEGRKILKLLQIAFDRRLTFTIGQSRTTGHTGVITWNDIHHKTNIHPNTQFGYPDPTYFDRVKDELTAKGVTEEDIK